MNNKLEEYYKIQKELNAYRYAMNIISWDAETEAPKMSHSYRGEQIAILSEKTLECKLSEKRQSIVNELFENRDQLSDTERRMIEISKKELDQTLKIPTEEQVEYSKLISDSQNVWTDAFHNDDYPAFKDSLAKIIETQQKFMKYRETEEIKGYNVLLDDFEEGMTIDDYENFFGTLKRDLVPFVKEVLSKGNENRPSIDGIKFSVEKQKEFCDYLMDVFAFDRDRGLIKESVHPFTWGQSTDDIRFTVKYLDDLLPSAIYSAAHELGHALYEQQIDPKYNGTNLGSGVSSGIHEAQSRFYENNIARSRIFLETHYPKLQELYSEELTDITAEDFYMICNEAKADFIRIEADELTYCLHIMVRYEIEKLLFSGGVNIEELPTVWNNMMEEYLGITPKSNSEGILQDIHWSCGLFGYFPTYALGSAIACQIDNTMRKEINVDQIIASGNLKEINLWLADKFHQHGSLKTPNQLLIEVTGEKLNPKYYVEYLIAKYTDLYFH